MASPERETGRSTASPIAFGRARGRSEVSGPKDLPGSLLGFGECPWKSRISFQAGTTPWRAARNGARFFFLFRRISRPGLLRDPVAGLAFLRLVIRSLPIPLRVEADRLAPSRSRDGAKRVVFDLFPFLPVAPQRGSGRTFSAVPDASRAQGTPYRKMAPAPERGHGAGHVSSLEIQTGREKASGNALRIPPGTPVGTMLRRWRPGPRPERISRGLRPGAARKGWPGSETE